MTSRMTGELMDQQERVAGRKSPWISSIHPPDSDRLIIVETKRDGVPHEIGKQVYSEETVQKDRAWWYHGYRVFHWMEYPVE